MHDMKTSESETTSEWNS